MPKSSAAIAAASSAVNRGGAESRTELTTSGSYALPRATSLETAKAAGRARRFRKLRRRVVAVSPERESQRSSRPAVLRGLPLLGDLRSSDDPTHLLLPRLE